jgi:hypothetical protein
MDSFRVAQSRKTTADKGWWTDHDPGIGTAKSYSGWGEISRSEAPRKMKEHVRILNAGI